MLGVRHPALEVATIDRAGPDAIRSTDKGVARHEKERAFSAPRKNGSRCGVGVASGFALRPRAGHARFSVHADHLEDARVRSDILGGLADLTGRSDHTRDVPSLVLPGTTDGPLCSGGMKGKAPFQGQGASLVGSEDLCVLDHAAHHGRHGQLDLSFGRARDPDRDPAQVQGVERRLQRHDKKSPRGQSGQKVFDGPGMVSPKGAQGVEVPSDLVAGGVPARGSAPAGSSDPARVHGFSGVL